MVFVWEWSVLHPGASIQCQLRGYHSGARGGGGGGCSAVQGHVRFFSGSQCVAQWLLGGTRLATVPHICLRVMLLEGPG